MSSQWVDANGDQWRFSSVSGSWSKLVNGTWTIAALPAGGLQRVSVGNVSSTVTAPPWPADNPSPDVPEWIDSQGDPWRQNPATGSWQKFLDGQWVNSSPPYGGLRRIGESDYSPPEIVVVETMGPQGPEGPRGPAGLSYIAISEVLPAQLQNGVNSTFSISGANNLEGQSIQVFRNGLLEIPGQGYLVVENTVIFTTPPLDSDVLTVIYQKAQ